LKNASGFLALFTDFSARRSTARVWAMPRGYMEGPASEEREAELERLERADPPPPEERLAVYGSTEDDASKHFLGWLGDVDPDELFSSGAAWGISVMRRVV
jgi:hypothetical protein